MPIKSWLRVSPSLGPVLYKGDDGGEPTPVEPVRTADDIAREQFAAQEKFALPAQQLAFRNLQDPESGALAQTQFRENVLRDVFGGEIGLQDQLVQNILQQLQNPGALTDQQQQAVDERRDLARGQFNEAQNTRANLGGGLFGGRSQAASDRGNANLENIFTEEDIARAERERLNASQLALAIQGIIRGQGVQSPNFVSPVLSASNIFSGSLQGRGQDVTQRGQDIQRQIAAQQAQAAQRSALFNALGQAGGALAGNVNAGIFKSV